MACNIRIHTKAFLIDNEVIDASGAILKEADFKEANNALTELANDKYAVGRKNKKLYTIEYKKKVAYMAEEDNGLLDLLQEAVDAYDLKEKTITPVYLSDLIKIGEPLAFANPPVDTTEEIEEDGTVEGREPIKLTTVGQRLENTLNLMDESLALQIAAIETEMSKLDKEKKADKKQLEVYDLQKILLKEVRDDMENYSDTKRILMVSDFVASAVKNLTAIQDQLNNIDYTKKKQVIKALKLYSRLLSGYDVVDQAEQLIADAITDFQANKLNIPASITDLIKLRADIGVFRGKFDSVQAQVLSVTKLAMGHKLNDIKYHPEVEYKHKQRLAKEAKRAGVQKKDIPQYIVTKMAGRDAEILQRDVDQATKELIENPAYDIYSADVMFSTELDVSPKLIQIMNQIITEIDIRKNTLRTEKDKAFEFHFNELTSSKNTKNITRLYKNILDYDSNGKAYLMGEYKASFITDVFEKIQEIRKEAEDKVEELMIEANGLKKGSKRFKAINREMKDIADKAQAAEDVMNDEHLTPTEEEGKFRPNDSWKNTTKLSKADQQILDFFIELSNEIADMTKMSNNSENNVKYAVSAKFYELPKMTKSDTERLFTKGDIKGILKDTVKDVSQERPDDIGYRKEFRSISGQKVNKLKLWYRDPSGNFSNADQSLDLMTIMRADYINATAYSLRNEAELELKFLVDLAKHKPIYESSGTTTIVKKVFGKKNKTKLNIIKGADSNTYKMMTNMLESRFYDVMHKNGITLGTLDINKVVSYINKSSAFLTLSLNTASGVANVINANAQLFLESFLKKGYFISAKGIAKAEMIYGKDLVNILKDNTRPINRSFTNQVTEYFNIKGLFNISEADFMKTDLLKAGLTMEALQVYQASGEHWIQSVTSMAVLDGVKVMNANHEYIDKFGNVVEKDKAASLLDMFDKEKDSDLVTLSDKVVYTSHSKLTKWNEGGRQKVDALVAKKLHDTIGNYMQNMQPEVMRHWGGKLLMLYRKYFISMGKVRLRGFETARKFKKDMNPNDRRFSYAIQEYEEGFYVTLIRYAANSLSRQKMNLLAKERVWDTLTDYEKHNIKKAITEIIMTTVMLPLLTTFVAGLAADDDSEEMYFLAYQIKRLDTELSAYRNPSEFFKMMRSPVPSARLIETAIVSLNFLKWGEVYKVGDLKGRNKTLIRLAKQFPVLKDFFRNYQDLYEFQSSGALVK